MVHASSFVLVFDDWFEDTALFIIYYLLFWEYKQDHPVTWHLSLITFSFFFANTIICRIVVPFPLHHKLFNPMHATPASGYMSE